MNAALQPADRSFRADIEGLRALAVLAVTLFHFDVSLFGGGYLGVDIFFVISGYLITGKILDGIYRGSFSFSGFYIARLRRIFPASTATLILTLAIGAIVFPPSMFESLSDSTIWSLFFAANFYFERQGGYFDLATSEIPLLHFWSLAVEEQFYLVWPAALVIVAAVFKRQHLALLTVLSFVSLVAVSEIWVGKWGEAVYYHPIPRVMEFMAGGLLVHAGRYFDSIPERMRQPMFLAAFAGLLGCIVTYSDATPMPGLAAVPPILLTAAVIGLGPASGMVLANRPLRFIGRISYSLYLVHWPAVVFYKYAFGEELGLRGTIILLIVSIAAAYLMWRFVETPFRKPREAGSARSQYAIIGGSTLGLAIVAALGVATAGMPARIGERQALYESWSEYRKPETLCRKNPSGVPLECVFGVLKKPEFEFAVLGDSHAIKMRDSLAPVVKRLHMKGGVTTVEGCPPLLGASLIHERLARWFDSCMTEIQDAFDPVLNDANIKIVVLAGRWAFYTRNDRLGESTAKGKVFLAASSQDPRTRENSLQVLDKALRHTVETLVAAGKKVVIVAQAPELAFDLQKCVLSPVGFLLPVCDMPDAAEIRAIMEPSASIIRSVADAHRGDVLAIDPFPYFCDEKNCRYREGENLLYADGNHLNQLGSALLANNAEQAIVDLANAGTRPAGEMLVVSPGPALP